MNKHYDIIVTGGGFAGVGAAIAAGRLGKKVLLIEKFNCLGGAACYDLVNPFMPYWTKTDNGKKQLSCGIFSEIISNLKENGGMDDSSQRFNEEILKIVLNRMVCESGVELLFNTSVISAKTEKGKINSVTVNGISGNEVIEADYFIDCTGDANLAFMSGFPFSLGRPSDNLCQPMTLCFRLGNVNKQKFEEEVEAINPLYKKLAAQGRFRNPREDVLLFRTLLDSVVHFNTTRVVKYNPTDIWEVTKVEIEAREQVMEMVDFLKSNFSCFSESQLISTGIQTGARESRMIDGLYTLGQEEMVACTKYKDGIAACNYDIDIHSPDGSGTSHYYFPAGCYYTIPYRCLVPKNSKNLLVAGRCVSATHEGQASLRIMPVCCNLGEAAGVAASVAVNSQKNVAEVDTDEIRSILKENDAVID
ncbi:MAG: FAD-dependent oxidoreductase [Ruminococcus sp.]|nr:FAD-dependent oxidoreductase [Candidatus Copronaster equi]